MEKITFSSRVQLADAAAAYIALRDRVSNPDGSFDRGGRFTLDAYFECCAGIRTPSRAYPYPEMAHARTIKHVAAARGVDAKELRREVKAQEKNP